MLALKLSVQLERWAGSRELLQAVVKLRSADGVTLASAATAGAPCAQGLCEWLDELSFGLSPSTMSAAASVVFELRTYAPGASPADFSMLATSSIPWEEFVALASPPPAAPPLPLSCLHASVPSREPGLRVGDEGWPGANEEIWDGRHAQSSGGFESCLTLLAPMASAAVLSGRLQYASAENHAARLHQLRTALTDASASAEVQRVALRREAGEAVSEHEALKRRLLPRLRGAARLRAEKEVVELREELESRLSRARERRDTLRSVNAPQGGLVAESTRVAQELQRRVHLHAEALAAIAQSEAAEQIRREDERNDECFRVVREDHRAAQASIDEGTRKAVGRMTLGFSASAEDAANTLRRRLGKLAADAAARASTLAAPALHEMEEQRAAVRRGREDMSADMAAVMRSVVDETERMSSALHAELDARSRTSRAELGRVLREQQAAHRQLRSEIRMALAVAEQSTKAALIRREGLERERNEKVQKQTEGDLLWLTQRLEAARAANDTHDMRSLASVSHGEAPPSSDDSFRRDLVEARRRLDAIDETVERLSSETALAEASVSAAEQVIDAVSSIERHARETLEGASSLSEQAAQTREVLDKMAGNARARFHERRERLSEQIESRERALCRISAGKAAKQEELLQLVRSRHESALQVSLSRAPEWFTILRHSMDRGEEELLERAQLIHSAEETHADELAADATRAEEELESLRQIHALKQQKLAADMTAAQQQIGHEQAEILETAASAVGHGKHGPHAIIEAAVAEAVRIGEERLREATVSLENTLPAAPTSEQSGAGLSHVASEEELLSSANLDDQASKLPQWLVSHYERLLAEVKAVSSACHRVNSAELQPHIADSGGHHLLHVEDKLAPSALGAVGTHLSCSTDTSLQDGAELLDANDSPFPLPSSYEKEDHQARTPFKLNRPSKGTEIRSQSVNRSQEERAKVVEVVSEEFSTRRDKLRVHRKERLRQRAESIAERVGTIATYSQRHSLEISRKIEDSARRAKAAGVTWARAHKDVLKDAPLLLATSKRLAASKRALAVDLVHYLKHELEEGNQQRLRYKLEAQNARKDIMLRRNEALAEAYETEAAEECLARMEMDHIASRGEWSRGFLATLVQEGIVTEESSHVPVQPLPELEGIVALCKTPSRVLLPSQGQHSVLAAPLSLRDDDELRIESVAKQEAMAYASLPREGLYSGVLVVNSWPNLDALPVPSKFAGEDPLQMKEIWKAVDEAVTGSLGSSAWDVIAESHGRYPVPAFRKAPPLSLAALEDMAELSAHARAPQRERNSELFQESRVVKAQSSHLVEMKMIEDEAKHAVDIVRSQEVAKLKQQSREKLNALSRKQADELQERKDKVEMLRRELETRKEMFANIRDDSTLQLPRSLERRWNEVFDKRFAERAAMFNRQLHQAQDMSGPVVEEASERLSMLQQLLARVAALSSNDSSIQVAASDEFSLAHPCADEVGDEKG